MQPIRHKLRNILHNAHHNYYPSFGDLQEESWSTCMSVHGKSGIGKGAKSSFKRESGAGSGDQNGSKEQKGSKGTVDEGPSSVGPVG